LKLKNQLFTKKMNDEIKTLLYERGASLVGFANLNGLEQNLTMGYPVAVGLAVALNPKIVSRIISGPHEDYSLEYNLVNHKLDDLGLFTEKWLVARGFDSFAVTKKRAPYEEQTCQTKLPHKTVARLAGLGWIGKNALLVTPDFGCAQRLSSVLTKAPLLTVHNQLESLCKFCRKCLMACPGKAISGVEWSKNTERDQMVDIKKCQKTAFQRGEGIENLSVACGLCMALCPFTKRYLVKSQSQFE
jgi:epoxyqueuosine reductase QueG